MSDISSVHMSEAAAGYQEKVCLLAQQWRRGGGLAFQEISPCSLWLRENVRTQNMQLPLA